MNKTSTQFDTAIKTCREVFIKKHKDYGTSWRIMRVSSILDQIFIKATRIRTIEENGMMKVDEGIEPEYMGIINYCVMGLIQIELKAETEIELSEEKVSSLYDKYIVECKALMQEKNHDYGEVWRNMQVSTFTDMLLMRIHRMRQILENDGKTIMSEGIDSNLMDMINYSVFALIRLKENKTT
ncbi:MAG: DUF1599 domain-containing protein [Bacteroidetes bacterium]|nr:DUF1599 domain-containing protein [Bacteroidota bacterium]